MSQHIFEGRDEDEQVVEYEEEVVDDGQFPSEESQVISFFSFLTNKTDY